MVHPHPHLSVSALRPDEDGSPWRLMPGVVLVLTAIIATMIAVSFLVSDLLAGKAY